MFFEHQHTKTEKAVNFCHEKANAETVVSYNFETVQNMVKLTNHNESEASMEDQTSTSRSNALTMLPGSLRMT